MPGSGSMVRTPTKGKLGCCCVSRTASAGGVVYRRLALSKAVVQRLQKRGRRVRVRVREKSAAGTAGHLRLPFSSEFAHMYMYIRP